LLERNTALLSRFHLHDQGGKFGGEFRVNKFHLFADAQHSLVQREAGSQHDAE